MKNILHFFSQLFVSNSPQANTINTLFLKFLILAFFITLLVGALVIIAAFKYRSKNKSGEPRQVSGNKKLELVWTVIPFIILSFFFILTLQAMDKINSPIPNNRQPDIIITAHQWWWNMSYAKYHVITANELHIPVNKKLLMQIKSADVVHDWWVPALGRKTDAVPGRTNYAWIEADSIRSYEGTCSEYCGAEHAWMRIKVIAQSEPDFDKWIHEQQEIPSSPTDSIAVAGDSLFQDKSCSDCHAVAGTAANMHIGPDLTHLSSRETILSGMLPNTKANLTRWLDDPQKVKPGAHMPNFKLTKNQVNELVTYLEELK
jgi:cytochrome c oxidase subunit II